MMSDHFEWVWQGGGDINDIFMIHRYYGWAAGNNLLLSTTDKRKVSQYQQRIKRFGKSLAIIYIGSRQAQLIPSWN